MINIIRHLIIISVIAICLYILAKTQNISNLQNISFKAIAILLGIKALVAFANAFKFKTITNIFNLNLNFIEWNGLCYITTFYSYFAPAHMGNVIAAIYLKQKFTFEYFKFITSMLGAVIIDTLIVSFVGLLVSFICYFHGYSFNFWFIGLFLIIFSSIIFIYPISKRFANIDFSYKNFKKLSEILSSFFNSINFFLDSPKLIAIFSVQAVISFLFRSLAIYFCFIVLDYTPNFLYIIIANCLVSYSFLIVLTPGNLGITEGALAASFYLVNLPLDPGIEVIALSRITSIIVQAILGLSFTYIIFGKILPTKRNA